MGARSLVAKMFASIGVRIDWREPSSCPAGVSGIQISLSRDPAGKRDSGAEALAFARPYEGSIVVFLDRVKELNRNEGPSVLAHVLVHEITDVLEGVDRHSATGVMKAHWGYGDYVLCAAQTPAFCGRTCPSDLRWPEGVPRDPCGPGHSGGSCP
jgi:hypothetical protein